MSIKAGIGLPIKNPEDRRHLINTEKTLQTLEKIEQEREYRTENLPTNHVSNNLELSENGKKIQQMKILHELKFREQMGFENQKNGGQNSLIFQPQNLKKDLKPYTQFQENSYNFEPKRSDFAEVKKHLRFNPKPALVTVLILGILGAGFYYLSTNNSALEKIKKALAGSQIGSDILSKTGEKTGENLENRENEKQNFEKCLKDGGNLENAGKINGCVLKNNVFLQEISLENWQENLKKNNHKNEEKTELLKKNIVPFSPLNIHELTTFKVGKDLNKDLILGNTVYSANVNNNSEMFGLMYATSQNFEQKPDFSQPIFKDLESFFTGGNFHTNFNKLIATDLQTLNKNQEFVADLEKLNEENIKQNFHSNKFRSILVKEKNGENDQFSLQIWIESLDSTILLEENFSKNENQKILEKIANCKAENENCVKDIFKEDENQKYIKELSLGLINKFRIF